MVLSIIGPAGVMENKYGSSGPKPQPVLSAAEWAGQTFGQVDLGDKRLNRRALEMGAKMAARPEASLPNQMQDRSALMAAYALLNNDAVAMEALLAPQYRQTLAAAGRVSVALMVEDTTELDFTAHPSKTGLGPIGNGKGRGLLLHTTLAVVPEGREVLGLAHAQIGVRQPSPKGHHHRRGSLEGQFWENSAKAIGQPPQGVIWVHVSDRGSDIFEYMTACVDTGKHFLLRAYQNRLLHRDAAEAQVEEGQDLSVDELHLVDYVRSLPPHPDAGYTVHVSAHKNQAAREARVLLQWTQVTIPPPTQARRELREHVPLQVWVLRVWEVDAPAGVDPIEWMLLSSLPITTFEEAYRAIDWYTCRWLCEDYHQCLKTGCKVEQTQLDDAADIRRLLGFEIPIAVRLLQLRQAARQTPELPAVAVVEPLMVVVLARRRKKDAQAMTIGEFWQAVARLGGHQGRTGDGPPGWRTVWRGWRYLSDLTEGARLFAGDSMPYVS